MGRERVGTENTNVGVDFDCAGNADRIELRRVECRLTESLWKRMLRRMFPDQRKQERLPTPPLVGYLGTANASNPYDVGDISLTGFCLLTGERWVAGTEMPITLKRTNLQGADDDACFTVQATVVRCDGDGVGFSIVLSEEESNAVRGNPLRVKWMSRPEMEQFLGFLKAGPEVRDGSSQDDILKDKESAHSGRGAQLNAAFEGGR
jgi:hypothetical protein